MAVEMTSNSDSGNSRLPVCERLVPRLRQNGQDWLIELARWYESNWNLALEGAPKPSADSVLNLITPDQQGLVREIFDSIDSRYTPLWNESDPRDTDHDPAETIVTDIHSPSGPQPAGDPSETQTLDPRSGTPREQSFSHGVDPDATLDTAVGDDATATLPPGAGQGPTDGLDDTTAPAIRIGRGGSRQTSPPDIPGYQIKNVLGRGGMGIVYLAHQEGIDRPVALKMILPRGQIDQVALDRFYAEARAIGRFQHENIVRIFDAGTHQGMPYFSLEYVDGASLADQLKGKPMDPREAARLMEPMARAMQVAHDDGVIHRDLKPANVLMTRDGVPKITDFGLAKELEQDQELSQDGSVIGTPAFMSPEQARGSRDVGPLADVYGLGALFYSLLTGRPPFQGAKPTDTLLQVIHNDPVEPIKLQPAIEKDLETICLKCLQKDPAERYDTAKALGDDLARFLRGEPIQARPVSRAERLWRWCRRNPIVASASAIAATLALVVMVGGPVSAAVIYQQKKDVVSAKEEAESNADLAKTEAVKATKARDAADKNAVAASVQERNALDALRRVTFQIQSRMSGKTNLTGLRKELIQIVKNGLEQIDKSDKTVREKNMLAAGIHSRMGEINLEIGRTDRALEEYKKCLEVFESLAADGKEIPFPDQNWSKVYQQLGESARISGQLNEADEYYSKSLEVRRGWTEKSPSIDSFTALAVALGNVGSIAQILGDLPRARNTMEEAITIRRRLFNTRSTHQSLAELLLAKVVFAKIVFQQGQTVEGIRLIGEAADRMRDHAKKYADNQYAQINSAMFDTEMAVMQLYVGEVEAAASKFQRAVDVFEALRLTNPYDWQIQEELEDALYGLLVTQIESDQEDYDAIISRLLELRRQAVVQDPESIGKRTRLVNALARCGLLFEGSQLAEELRESIEPNDPMNYVLACAYAQLAKARISFTDLDDDRLKEIPTAEQFQDASVATLQTMLDGGFSRPTDLKLDPDLDPLRKVAAFQELIKEKVATP